ncbi:MAG: hypothetical protein F6K55_01600 [Moorea sp. SIO4A3]|nr:hypothetical protein [Moorena sp. SIO4A3]
MYIINILTYLLDVKGFGNFFLLRNGEFRIENLESGIGNRESGIGNRE